MDKYAQRWRAYRFWNRVGIFALFALLPVVAFSAFLTRGSSDSSGALYRIRSFRCPRCGKTFNVEGWWLSRTRSRKCVHCALELDTGPT